LLKRRGVRQKKLVDSNKVWFDPFMIMLPPGAYNMPSSVLLLPFIMILPLFEQKHAASSIAGTEGKVEGYLY